MPILSFDVVSFPAGLTWMGFWRLLVATSVGTAPATFVYAYLGGRAPQYVQVSLVALGVVAAIVRRRRRDETVP